MLQRRVLLLWMVFDIHMDTVAVQLVNRVIFHDSQASSILIDALLLSLVLATSCASSTVLSINAGVREIELVSPLHNVCVSCL